MILFFSVVFLSFFRFDIFPAKSILFWHYFYLFLRVCISLLRFFCYSNGRTSEWMNEWINEWLELTWMMTELNLNFLADNYYCYCCYCCCCLLLLVLFIFFYPFSHVLHMLNCHTIPNIIIFHQFTIFCKTCHTVSKSVTQSVTQSVSIESGFLGKFTWQFI